jgi:hypothetical protein
MEAPVDTFGIRIMSRMSLSNGSNNWDLSGSLFKLRLVRRGGLQRNSGHPRHGRNFALSPFHATIVQ